MGLSSTGPRVCPESVSAQSMLRTQTHAASRAADVPGPRPSRRADTNGPCLSCALLWKHRGGASRPCAVALTPSQATQRGRRVTDPHSTSRWPPHVMHTPPRAYTRVTAHTPHPAPQLHSSPRSLQLLTQEDEGQVALPFG